MKLTKKGQVGSISGFIMAIGVAAVVLAVILVILPELSTAAEQASDPTWTTASGTVTAAGNAIGLTVTKMSTIPTWVGLIIIAGLAFIVLGFFMYRCAMQ